MSYVEPTGQVSRGLVLFCGNSERSNVGKGHHSKPRPLKITGPIRTRLMSIRSAGAPARHIKNSDFYDFYKDIYFKTSSWITGCRGP